MVPGLGYGLYYGLQSFAGLDEFQAGSTAQLIVFLGVLFTWVVTYLFRVGSKVKFIVRSSDTKCDFRK